MMAVVSLRGVVELLLTLRSVSVVLHVSRTAVRVGFSSLMISKVNLEVMSVYIDLNLILDVVSVALIMSTRLLWEPRVVPRSFLL